MEEPSAEVTYGLKGALSGIAELVVYVLLEESFEPLENAFSKVDFAATADLLNLWDSP